MATTTHDILQEALNNAEISPDDNWEFDFNLNLLQSGATTWEPVNEDTQSADETAEEQTKLQTVIRKIAQQQQNNLEPHKTSQRLEQIPAKKKLRRRESTNIIRKTNKITHIVQDSRSFLGKNFSFEKQEQLFHVTEEEIKILKRLRTSEG